MVKKTPSDEGLNQFAVLIEACLLWFKTRASNQRQNGHYTKQLSHISSHENEGMPSLVG
jgi:hypothetical protein